MAGQRQQNDNRKSHQENGNAFSQHAQQDAALNPPADETPQEGMSFVAKTLIFLGFPLFVGLAGLYVGYLRMIQKPESKIDFDNDFVFPFLLALAMVVVIAIQSKGFSRKEITPLVQWPTVKRKKKIIRKRIIVDDDGNEIKEEEKND